MSVQGGGMVIDSLGYSRAFYELFEGAIYMHRAKQFLVHQLDLSSKRALSRPVKVGYYTTCRYNTNCIARNLVLLIMALIIDGMIIIMLVIVL